jgi:protein-disulfide isomerase
MINRHSDRGGIAHLAASLTLLMSVATGPTLAQQPDPLIEQRTKGDPAAPVKIYEVSDFQCSHCRAFVRQILPAIDREYIDTGKAQLIFVNLPLIDLHENAAAAHEFAMCAARQDRFWPVHDLLFRHQPRWSELEDPAQVFMAIADSAGLEPESLSSCINTGAVRWLVQAEAEAVARQGVRSTPSFIVEQGVIAGIQPMEVWRSVLDSLFLAKTGGR